jgi:NADH pyrophosphatase NudC (nudix superfamily)
VSERSNRTNGGIILADRLKQLRESRKRNDLEEKAFEVALSALAEEPRKLTTCDLILEYVPVSSWQSERAHCSGCKNVMNGWSENWHFCPGCGSKILSAERESSPHDRLTRMAVADALENFGQSVVTKS